MSQRLRVRLEGDEADLGRVAASDFAHLLLGTQSAIQRAAGHIIGRGARETGRPGKIIEDSTRLRLVAIERGSVVAVLEAPESATSPERLDLSDRQLGEIAIDVALDTAAGDEEDLADVADTFVRVAEEVGVGRRYDAIILEQPDAPQPRAVRIDSAGIERLIKVARRLPPAKEDTVIGLLVEADFESYTARLRGPGGSKTQVRFPPELADEIQHGLREQARLRGEVHFDPVTAEARAVELRELISGDQLALDLDLDPGDFWTNRTVAELADELGIKPIDQIEILRDAEATDDEVDRFFAALEET